MQTVLIFGKEEKLKSGKPTQQFHPTKQGLHTEGWPRYQSVIEDTNLLVSVILQRKNHVLYLIIFALHHLPKILDGGESICYVNTVR
jgi:hypothetical protein